jgi:hypothetical protein
MIIIIIIIYKTGNVHDVLVSNGVSKWNLR